MTGRARSRRTKGPTHPVETTKCGDEHLQALVDIAQRASGVRCPGLTHARPQRRQHKLLPTGPTAVDGRLCRARSPSHLLEGEAAVSDLTQYRQRRIEHRGVDLGVTRTPADGSNGGVRRRSHTQEHKAICSDPFRIASRLTACRSPAIPATLVGRVAGHAGCGAGPSPLTGRRRARPGCTSSTSPRATSPRAAMRAGSISSRHVSGVPTCCAASDGQMVAVGARAARSS